MAKGTIFKFHNDLDTDQIIASQYLLLPNLEEMKEQEQDSYLIEQQSQKIAELERHISQITQQSQKKDGKEKTYYIYNVFCGGVKWTI